MLDGPVILQVYLPVVDVIHQQSSKFVMVVKIKVTNGSNRNDSPALSGCPDKPRVLFYIVRYAVRINCLLTNNPRTQQSDPDPAQMRPFDNA